VLQQSIVEQSSVMDILQSNRMSTEKFYNIKITRLHTLQLPVKKQKILKPGENQQSLQPMLLQAPFEFQVAF